MDRQALSRKIMRIGDDVRRLEQDLTALQSLDLVNYPDNYSNLSQQVMVNGEYICRKLRELVYSTTNISWTDLLERSANELDIRVSSDTKGIIDISLPCLIPNRKKKPTDFITAPLSAALERFVLVRQPIFERFKHCVICITHIYNKSMYNNGRKRDHDNIEIKGIIDVINTFLLTDDTGNLCDIYNSSEFSDEDSTQITIIKKDMFLEWIIDTNTSRKTIPK